MGKYSYNDNSKTDVIVKKMIPILVRWAQSSWDKIHYYKDLSDAIGYESYHIGDYLGCIEDVLRDLREEYKQKIPTLNALVALKNTGLPGKGFEYVFEDYNSKSTDFKQAFVKGENKKAHEYDWEWVLNVLNLEPVSIISQTELEKLRKNIAGFEGGESAAHKKLKQYVAKHPEVLHIMDVIESKTETEHFLLSGDRLDVYFETLNAFYAIEVKSYISDNDDVRRGIFQCIKYKAVLEAERIYENTNKACYAILVVETPLSSENQQTASDLNVIVKVINLRNCDNRNDDLRGNS
jgi:hypothetical protein